MKMRACIVAVLIGGLGGGACAQAAAPHMDAQAEQDRIRAARQLRSVELDERAKRCNGTFAVTQCLAEVRSERLSMDAMMDKRERALTDSQRETQSREQLERVRLKQEEHDLKLARQNLVQSPRSAEKPKQSSPVPTTVRQLAKSKDPVVSVAQRQINQQQYVKRQQAAEEKRAAVKERVAKISKPSASLPLPP